MLARTTVASILSLALVATAAAAERYEIEKGRSQLVFSVPYVHGVLGEALGEFEDLAAEVVYDVDDPGLSQVVVRVRTASVKTQFEARDVDLRSDKFFASERYPEAVFRSQRIERGSDGFHVDGSLELRGHTRPVAIRFNVQELTVKGERRLWVTGSTRLDRSDFGIEGPGLAGDFVIGDWVSLRFNLMLEPTTS